MNERRHYLIRIEFGVIRPVLVTALEIEGFPVERQAFFDEHQSHFHGTDRSAALIEEEHRFGFRAA